MNKSEDGLVELILTAREIVLTTGPDFGNGLHASAVEFLKSLLDGQSKEFGESCAS